MSMKFLVVAPHPDDESIGVGGVIRQHVMDAHAVTCVFISHNLVRKQEALEAMAILGVDSKLFLDFPDGNMTDHLEGITEALRRIIKNIEPDYIYAPHRLEIHSDHAAVSLATLHAAKRAALDSRGDYRVAPVYGYEVWTPITRPVVIRDITNQNDIKQAAIRRYASQLKGKHFDIAATCLARWRGIMHGNCTYAEAFDRVE